MHNAAHPLHMHVHGRAFVDTGPQRRRHVGHVEDEEHDEWFRWRVEGQLEGEESTSDRCQMRETSTPMPSPTRACCLRGTSTATGVAPVGFSRDDVGNIVLPRLVLLRKVETFFSAHYSVPKALLED